ncbi:hypothetical protein C819_01644 [Lachnospiraceae bacterium 10-1]|nr:hypothetical protein C819_01644 [Lachnospiraceae bacterium 10-1]
MREQQNYRAAIYCRLSSEDGADHESMSIGNQRALLTEYVQKQGCGLMSILWTKKVERLCCFFEFLILLLLWCQITNRAMYPLTVIPAFYVFKDCSAGFL